MGGAHLHTYVCNAFAELSVSRGRGSFAALEEPLTTDLARSVCCRERVGAPAAGAEDAGAGRRVGVDQRTRVRPPRVAALLHPARAAAPHRVRLVLGGHRAAPAPHQLHTGQAGVCRT